MKRILFLVLLVADLFAASGPVWTAPSKVKVTTFAINDYSIYRFRHGITSEMALKSLDFSKMHEQTFVDELFSALEKNYPGKKKYKDKYASAKNSEAISRKFRESVLYNSEFVFFSGHGDQQELLFYDYSIKLRAKCCCDKGDVACFEMNGLSNKDVCPSSGYVCANDEYGKVFGGDTRWVILDACLTLNVNKSDRLHLPLSMENIDLTKVNQLRSVFSGVHAILGFYSDDHQGALYLPDKHPRSEYFYSYFVENFIEKKETIWNSFSMASAQIVDDFENRFGLKPAIAFLRGYDKNGVYHDTSTETFDRTFNKPIQIEGSIELFVMYEEYGIPSYHDLIYK